MKLSLVYYMSDASEHFQILKFLGGKKQSYEIFQQYGEQGWRSRESARLPPMWPGFDSGPVSYVG